MSRLAATGTRVFYFACTGYHQHKARPMAGPLTGTPNVHVYTMPYAPGATRLAGVRRWMSAMKINLTLLRHGVRRPILWYYHPSLFSLGYACNDALTVYDVMDHFSSFEQSDHDIYFDEMTLLAESDIVFTGGRTLDQHTRGMLHLLVRDLPNEPDRKPPATPPVHCYPSGIDLEHFASTRQIIEPADSPWAHLPQPRLGYFGAIDERIDWDLVHHVASTTEGSLILAGPILRHPTRDLPPNVHLPGAVEYSALPDLLAALDVCLIPFKNSALVQHISPTKTPEYLAAGKPVVSTPIPDVITDYGDLITIAADAEQFAQACRHYVQNPPDPQTLADEATRRARTWDQIAQEMQQHLRQHLKP